MAPKIFDYIYGIKNQHKMSSGMCWKIWKQNARAKVHDIVDIQRPDVAMTFTRNLEQCPLPRICFSRYLVSIAVLFALLPYFVLLSNSFVLFIFVASYKLLFIL